MVRRGEEGKKGGEEGKKGRGKEEGKGKGSVFFILYYLFFFFFFFFFRVVDSQMELREEGRRKRQTGLISSGFLCNGTTPKARCAGKFYYFILFYFF